VAAIYTVPFEQQWVSRIHKALKAAEARGEIEYKASENVSNADYERVMREYATGGNQLIVGEAFAVEAAARKVAKDFPKVSFLMGSSGKPQAPNFSVFDNYIQEPAYLTGMIAGGMTKSNKIGMVGGFPIPEVNRLMNAFMAGAKETNPKVEFTVSFINSWFDPPKAKEAAFAMIDKGADVMYAERFGVSDAAKEKGKLAIGNVINTQDSTPTPWWPRRCGTWSPPSTARIKLVKEGKFKAEDYGHYSMMKYKGSELARWARSRRRCRPTSWPRSRPRRRTSWTASSPSRWTTASPSRPPSKAFAGHGRTLPDLRLIDGITKRFGALVANDGISLTLHARRGAGAAGRERRRQEHAGVDPVRPLRGRRRPIEVTASRCRPATRRALAAGIGMVHQHFTLADNLSVLDNVMLGTESLWQPFSRRAAARAALLAVAQRFGLQVDPDARMGSLSVGERQRVEILKALVYRGAPHPDPGRAHRRADAAGERGAVRHPGPDGGAGPVHHLHQPQARRGAARVAPHRRAARRQAGGAGPPPAPRRRSWRRMVGHAVARGARGKAAPATAADVVCALQGVTVPVATAPGCSSTT
jgi:basic membrane protein A